MIDAGVRRIHVLAWRDLDDVDAGGSEVHADELMSRWATAGLDIVHRTSAASRPAGARSASWVRGDPAGQPLHRLPTSRCCRAARTDGPIRRPRRDLERRSVVLAAVVSEAATDDRPPRPRPDVGPDHAAAVRRDRSRRGSPGRPAVLPARCHRDPLRIHPRGAARTRFLPRQGHGGAQRGRGVLHARWTAIGVAARGGRRPLRPREAVPPRPRQPRPRRGKRSRTCACAWSAMGHSPASCGRGSRPTMPATGWSSPATSNDTGCATSTAEPGSC